MSLECLSAPLSAKALPHSAEHIRDVCISASNVELPSMPFSRLHGQAAYVDRNFSLIKACQQRSSSPANIKQLQSHPLHEPTTTTVMTSFSKIFILPFVALAFASQTGAAPLEKRDIFSPPVLYPHSGTEWYHGQRHNITW